MELVSLLTPCYNMERYISRLLDSVLSQTYPNIEMIVVDDGSSDKSADIIQSYIPKFFGKGYSLKYVFQSNSGQSVALQNGLLLVKGKYLIWPDADDFFADSNSIDIFVRKISLQPSDVAIVRARQNILDENTLKVLKVQGSNEERIENSSLFEDCLFCKNGFYWGAGAYMVRMEALKNVTNLNIYTSKDAGQNWQLFLPLLYSYKCLSIKEILYNVLERQTSHSRGLYNGFERTILKLDVYEKTLYETLDRIKKIPQKELLEYKDNIRHKYLIEKLNLSFTYHKKEAYIKYSQIYKLYYPQCYGIKKKLSYYLFKYGFQYLLYLRVFTMSFIKK